MKNLAIFLVASFCIQLVSSETIPEVVQEIGPIVENRIAEVGQLLGIVGRDIGLTFGEIQKNIKDVIQALSSEIGGINNAVDSSLARAAELSRNVDDCVSAATSGVSALDLNVLQKCSISNELTEVQKLIPQIASLSKRLGTLTGSCVVGSIDAASVRTCLEDGLQQIDSSVESLTANVRSLIDGALENSRMCVDGGRAAIEDSISSIGKSLDECVSAVLN